MRRRIFERLACSHYRQSLKKFFSASEDDKLERFLTHKEFSDYRWGKCVESINRNNPKDLLFQLEKLRGLRLGFTHSDPAYIKFRNLFPEYLSKLSEQQMTSCYESLFHIGIKDPLLAEELYDFIRRSFEYLSFNGLLKSMVYWEDTGLFGYKMLVEDQFKVSFFNKVRGLYKKMNLEDLVLSAFVLDCWEVPIDPLISMIKQLNFDNLNSNKTFSVNAYPKLVYLLMKYEDHENARKVLDQVSILMSLSYEQQLQSFELSDSFQLDIGVYDPLHWKSIGLYVQTILALGLDSRETFLYVEEAIQRKYECQLCDFTDCGMILKGTIHKMEGSERVKVVQMVNNLIHKEPENVPAQLTPAKFIELIEIVILELRYQELNRKELATLLSCLLDLVVKEEFDSHLEEEDNWFRLNHLLGEVPESAQVDLLQVKEYVRSKIVEHRVPEDESLPQ